MSALSGRTAGIILCFLTGLDSAKAQKIYTGAFQSHTVKLTSRTNCATAVTNATYYTATATIPVVSTCGGAATTGQFVLAFPATLPKAVQEYLLTFETPLTTNIDISVRWTAPSAKFTGSVFVYRNDADQRGDLCPSLSLPRALPQGDTAFSAQRPCSVKTITPGYWASPGQVVFSYFVGAQVSDGYSIPSVVAQVQSIYLLEVTPPPPVDLAGDHLEAVQVVQDAANTVPLVADKSTVVRVFAKMLGDTAQPLKGVTARLRAQRYGNELPGSPLSPVNGPITVSKTFDRSKADESFNFLLPREWTYRGPLSLLAEVVAPPGVTEDNVSNNFGQYELEFTVPSGWPELFRVAYWPICVQSAGGQKKCPSDNIGRFDILMQQLFPVADNGIEYRPWTAPQKIWRQPLATHADRSRLVAALRKFYDMIDQDSSIDQLAAWLPQDPAVGTLGQSDPHWANEGGQGRISINADTSAQSGLLDANFTLAHETGHNLGLRHVPTADSCDAKDDQSPWPYPNANIQEVGFAPLGMEVKPATKMDLMTYCSPPGSNIWISPFNYRNLLATKVLERISSAAKQGQRATSAAAEYLVISGSARRDGASGQLDPAYRLTSGTPGASAAAAGTHCIRFFGAGGMLGQSCFTLTFEEHRSHQQMDEESFSLKVPFVAGTTRIALMQGEQELTALNVGSGDPALSILSPQAGDRWDGSRAIAWSASDPDGAALAFSVLYSSDGARTWLPIEVDLREQQFTFDTAEVAAGSQVHFRVLASNGLNTTEATVGPLEIVAAARIEAQPQLDFGSVMAGGSASGSVSIRNRGSGPLTVASISSSSALFRLLSPALPVTIPAGERRELSLLFSPAAAGRQAASLALSSDDDSRPSLSVALSGLGVMSLGPGAALSPARLDFGSVTAGQSKDLTLAVRNTGAAPLTVTLVASSSGLFRITAPAAPFTVAPGSEQPVTVRFSPAAPGAQSATLSLSSDGGNLSAPLTGTGASSGTPPAVVQLSDSFNRANADRCALGVMDLALGGSGVRYYLPIFSMGGNPATPAGANIVSGTLENNGLDFGGVQVTSTAGACANTSIHGVSLGQDLNLRADLRVPTDASARISQAGPYLRSRAAARGDGILGGASAGYWVQLHSTGEVKVKNLSSGLVIAASGKPAAFDATVFHSVEVAAQGATLQVSLDGELLTFMQGSAQVTTLAAPATAGSNDGAGGIAFAAENNRGLIGGQRARNFVVTAYRPLTGLPVRPVGN
ncbi:MAG: choice-of-anchor D domain-containing protein [Acidobacteria bacterium]|nr:choice-of-anchor D domain-containing protein [Acidobacteriota bacterium]